LKHRLSNDLTANRSRGTGHKAAAPVNLDVNKESCFRSDEMPQVPDYARKPPKAKQQKELFGQ
jgi:hypothetical protein